MNETGKRTPMAGKASEVLKMSALLQIQFNARRYVSLYSLQILVIGLLGHTSTSPE